MSVLLSIGRHEEYGQHLNLPISGRGALRAWFSCKVMTDKCGKPDIIYASPIARAEATAKIRAAAWGNIPLEFSEDLAEEASAISIEAFKLEILAVAAEHNWQHIHLVSHAPTISRLNGGIAAPLNPGDVLVWKADNWESMEKGIIRPSLIRTYKVEETAEFALAAGNMTARPFHSINEFIIRMQENN